LATFVDAARGMKERGSFAWMPQMVAIPELSRLLAEGTDGSA
jgi:hypothetical protein